ncbi:MAG: SLC13 family permease [Planctomycetota bacterium]
MSKQAVGRVIAMAVVTVFATELGLSQLESHGLPYPGYVALGILAIAATLWVTEAVPLFVTSLAVLFLSIVWLVPSMRDAGTSISPQAFYSPFFSDVIVLFLGGFSLSAALKKKRLDEWLASKIIHQTGSTFPKLLLGVMAVTAVLSMWLSNTATAAMMLAMVLPLANRFPENHGNAKALLLAIPFAANIGGLGTPIGSPPNAIAMQYMSRAGIAPDFSTWMLIGLPGVAVMLGLAWGTLLVLFRESASPMPETSGDLVRVTLDRSILVITLTVAITVFGWMTASLHGLSSGTIAMIPLLVFFGTGILQNRDLRDMSWDVLLMMGGGLCLGTVIAESGLADWLVAQLPVDGLGIFMLTALFGTVACTMSSLMSNTATANLLLPIIIGLSVETTSPIMIGTAFGCSLAMPLPISTPPNAMAFSSGKINVGDMVRPGLLLTIVGVSLALTTGYAWWKAMGLW